jgi:predicted amidohydrolase
LDLLVVPMARSFDKVSPDRDRWLREERQVYLEAVENAGCPTVIVNGLESNSDEASFGGAMVINAEGGLLAESPHGSDEILIYDF